MFDSSSHNHDRRTFLKLLGLSGLAIVLDACNAFSSEPPPVLPVATLTSTPPPSPEGLAQAFLQAWTRSDYAAMYGMLAPKSQAGITRDDFVKRYQSTAAEATVTAVRPQLSSVHGDVSTATVQFRSRLETALFGGFEEENALALVYEGNRWGVVWSPSNILKDLDGGNVLRFFPAKSTRGNIYDRTGQPIALGQEAIQVSVWPAEMRRNQVEARVLAALSPVLNLSQFDIQRRYGNADPEWKIPIATISKDIAQSNAEALSLPGVVTEKQDARAYPQGLVAAHVAGYVGQISADELSKVYAQGYREGDMLGRSGLEKAGEKFLTGIRGGRLVVIAPNGKEVATLSEKPAQQSQSIYSTLDLDLQKFVDDLLGSQRGSIIVMNVKNGDILALASHPSYDPNAFVDSSRQKDRQAILTDAVKPLLNRATQGAYPQGSVQKIITESAALERGGLGQFTPFT